MAASTRVIPYNAAMRIHLCRVVVSVCFVTSALSAFAQTTRDAPAAYVQLCLSCHGSTGGNGSAATLLDDSWLGDGSDAFLAQVIREGVPNQGMPPFPTLTEEDARALVIYIRELRSIHDRGGEEGGHVSAQLDYTSKYHDFHVETVVDGLKIPWSIAFLPDGDWLICERPGQLRLVHDGKLDPEPIADTPQVYARSQGGLLEVALSPDYADTGWVYLVYTEGQTAEDKEVSMTVVARGRIKDHTWVDHEMIFRAPLETYVPRRYHYGSRLAFDDEGHLFFPIGERGYQDMAQQLDKPNGKIHRLNLDGSIPDDNPFVDDLEAMPSVWSLGHRNPQGLDFHPVTGELYNSEHGPRGGDEINLIKKGANYGWPVITYGMNYDGTPITEKTHAPGMEQPVHHWTPSIAVIGIDFYEGDRFPQWRNDLLVSSIASGNLRRLRIDGDTLIEDELLFNDHGRLRDVASGPDGLIYVLTTEGQVLRLSPK